MTTSDVQRLESERLRPTPHDLDPLAESFRRLLDLIAAECCRAGYLPASWPGPRPRHAREPARAAAGS